MNKTISLDQLPPQIENLLRASWEGHESLVLEHNGKPVAAIVPMDEYRKWHPDESENAFDYALPTDILEAYHELLDKKFATGLTSEEEIKLAELNQQLDNAEAARHSYNRCRDALPYEMKIGSRDSRKLLPNCKN